MNSVFYLILCRFKSRKVHNAVSFFVVAMCVSILLIALSLSNGFEEKLIDKILLSTPHVAVFGEYETLSLDDKQQIDRQVVIAQVQALAINPKNNYVNGVLLRGVLADQISTMFKGKNILLNGSYPDSGEVLIGSKFAENNDLNIGDTVQILTGPAIAVELVVSGIFRVGLYDFDSTVMIGEYQDVLSLSPEEGEGIASKVNVFRALWLNDPFSSSAFSAKLQKMHQQLIVTNWQDDNKTLVAAIEVEKQVIFIVLLLLVLSVSVAIANSQFVQILSQNQQIAILSALGYTRKYILMTFLLEGLVIGILGSILGVLVSLSVLFYLMNFPIHLPVEVYQVEFIPVYINYSDFTITVLAAILFICLSSFVPAFYASKLDPVQILRKV